MTGKIRGNLSKVTRILSSAKNQGRSVLLENEADEIAKMFKIPVARAALAKSEREALKIADKIGFPLAMKVVSKDIVHKSDIGGVKLGISKPSEVKKAYEEIIRNVKKAKTRALIDGIYLQEMAPKAQEFVIGATRDPQFGPTIMFGLGGIYVELFKDVSFRLAPITKRDAISMMMEIKSSPLLTGFRGSVPLDIDSAAMTIVAIGDMISKFSDIESIDINPILVYEKRAIAVDIRIILGR